MRHRASIYQNMVFDMEGMDGDVIECGMYWAISDMADG